MAAAGHQHQLASAAASAELGGEALAAAVLAPGATRSWLGRGAISSCAAGLGQQTKPKLFAFGQQHHPQHRCAPMHQGQMHRVFARAQQEILGAIEGIQQPQPLTGQWQSQLQRLSGGFLT